MGADISFPAHGGGAERSYAFTTSLVGYRLASAFQPFPAGTPLLGFGVQLLVSRATQITAAPAAEPAKPAARPAAPPAEPPAEPAKPPALEDREGDLGEVLGRTATLTVRASAAVEAYTFRDIALRAISQRSFRTVGKDGGHLVVRVACLDFSFAPVQLANTNATPNGVPLIEMPCVRERHLEHAAGVAGFSVPVPVVNRAKFQKAPAGGREDFEKGFERAESERHADGSGAVAFATPRDARNEWLNALLIFNAAQNDAVPERRGGPAAEPDPSVAGGEMSLQINGAVWPAREQKLTDKNVGAYFVDEVWGWCHHFDPISPAEACGRVPVAAATPVSVADWLRRPLGALRAERIAAAEPVVGPVTERVCVRFRSGLKNAALFT